MKISNTAERLKQIMDERGLRQVDIVDLCKPFCEQYDVKIEKPHISQYVSGFSEPRSDKLAILSMALGVDETWLMGYDNDKTEKPSDADRGLSKNKEELLDLISNLTEQEAAVYLSALKTALKK